MQRPNTAPIVALAIALTLAGCTGSDGDGGDDTSPTDPADGNQTQQRTAALAIQLLNSSVDVGQPVGINWTVALTPDEPGSITHTAVHWANFSVADPQGPGDYGNATGVQEPADVPGTFSAEIMPDVSETLFIRAHAIVDGEHFWSDEVTVTVEAAMPPGQAHEVSIGTTTAGPAANYAPTTINIAVGDSVKWTNADPTSTAHTATSDAGVPKAFDTGSIAGGSSSQPIIFDVPGDYVYHCALHPSSMTGAHVVVS